MNHKIGLFFGSFNPIHIGHIIIANHIVENTDLQEVWFIVSPHNPLKDKKTLLKDHLRLQMVQLVSEEYSKCKASNIEFSLPKPSYTVDTLAFLQEKYPNKEFVLIMGEDNIVFFHKWKNYEYILQHYEIVVYPRVVEIQKQEEKCELHKAKKITRIKAPIIEISSTMIRNMIKDKKNIKPLLSSKVFEFIDGSNLYK